MVMLTIIKMLIIKVKVDSKKIPKRSKFVENFSFSGQNELLY